MQKHGAILEGLGAARDIAVISTKLKSVSNYEEFIDFYNFITYKGFGLFTKTGRRVSGVEDDKDGNNSITFKLSSDDTLTLQIENISKYLHIEVVGK